MTRPQKRILTRTNEYCVVEVMRGIGPLALVEWAKSIGMDSPVLASVFYSAYALSLALVVRDKTMLSMFTDIQCQIECLVEGEVNERLACDEPVTTSGAPCRSVVQPLATARSNSRGMISLVIVYNQRHRCQPVQFRKHLRRLGHPVLGSAREAQPFRGEKLAMSMISLSFKHQGEQFSFMSKESQNFRRILGKEEDYYRRRGSGGAPPEYETGLAPFYNLSFQVSHSVMIPRQGSETLVDAALQHVRHQDGEGDSVAKPRILDLGTGSGCLVISVLKSIPHAIGVAVDISEDALQIARQNAEQLGVAGRCTWIQSSFDDTPFLEAEAFDVIVCNPPYHTRGGRKRLDVRVIEHEPHSALFVTDHSDPLKHYRSVLAQSHRLLNPFGIIVFEVFKDNCVAVGKLLNDAGFADVRLVRDARGLPRVVCGVKRDITK